MVGGYSARWREVFGEVDPARTAVDADFLRRALPLSEFRRVLDVPCGAGRLMRALRELGYDVTGVDADPAVAPDVVADLRDLDGLATDFDAVINMWASFGYFDAEENARVLASFSRRLRPGGRLVLDVFNREFFRSAQGERELRPGIVERSIVVGNRRRCEIEYGDGTHDRFEWQLYGAAELEHLAHSHGLVAVETVASPERPSMQLVLQRDT